MKLICYNLDPLPGYGGEVVPDLEIGKKYNLCTEFEDDDLNKTHVDIGRLVADDQRPLFTHSIETGQPLPEAELVKWYHIQWFTKKQED